MITHRTAHFIFLVCIACVTLTASCTMDEYGQGGHERVLGYLQDLRRPDGGYGWPDQPDGHLTPTFAVIGAHRILGTEIPAAEEVAEFLRTHHPVTGVAAETMPHESPLQNLTYQQIQGLLWLGKDASSFKDDVQQWKRPYEYARRYEIGGNPVFIHEMMAYICRDLLDLPVNDLDPEMQVYLQDRRRPNGSFNTVPASEGGDGNVLNTLWGLRALSITGQADSLRDETIAWLQALQLPGGGFTYRPDPDLGGIDDVAYTWAALSALELLGAEPIDSESSIQYLLSLWNDDGGFGDRPGLPSRPMATFYALDALRALGALEALDTYQPQAAESGLQAETLPEDLKVFTIQLEAQGNGSPIEAVELARRFGIHLWGAKNPEPGWIAAAQAAADARNVPVTFFVSSEDYGLFAGLPGEGTYSHLSDPIAPAHAESLLARPDRQHEVDSWPSFRERRIAPLEEAGGRMVWQICDNEPFSRILLDESIKSGSGYAAISTFHMAQNFADFLPFLFRYRYEIPFVTLLDAHGPEAWWWVQDMAGMRTLFLAKEPTWEGWLEALEHNRVVAVRRDEITGYRARLLGGAPGVQEFVRAHEDQWRFWKEASHELDRPWVSLVAITPDDPFEVSRPSEGIALRVRLWWNGRHQRTQQVVELVDLTIDGRSVQPDRVEQRTQNGQLLDPHYVYHIPDTEPGLHEAAVTVRHLTTGEEKTETITFTIDE